ncbi:MAG: adenosylhomocysteinase [Candidatus Velthaea sp.]|jgi:adenosylhomocysteinase
MQAQVRKVDEWRRRLSPLTYAESDRIAKRDFSGRAVSGRTHLTGDIAATFGALARAGARVTVCACNLDSTDPAVVEDLRAQGATVYGKSGMSPEEDAHGLAAVAAGADDVISDMGGELIVAAVRRGATPKAALEATGSGITRLLAAGPIPFPVFNWDDVRLKEGLHNRFHVGATVWPAYEAITAMNLFTRKVAVLGFGPVGRGVAERARALGAVVTVIEPDPVRRLEAAHLGLATSDPAEAVASADVVVTATGRAGVLGEPLLREVKDGAVLFNCGHAGNEIDIAWLETHGRRQVRPLIAAYDLPKGTVYLLNRGNLLNLAPGLALGADLFDTFGTLMLLSLEWLLDGGANGAAPGLQPLPVLLERRVAEALLARRGQ